MAPLGTMIVPLIFTYEKGDVPCDIATAATGSVQEWLMDVDEP